MKTATKNFKEIIVNPGSRNAEKEQQKDPFVLKLIRIGFGLFSPIFPKLSARIAYKFFTTPQGRAQHHQSDDILDQVKISEFMSGKRLLKLYEWGEGEKVVLLAHGWRSRGTALRSFVPKLLEAGYKIVAFDGPAHGDSPGHRLNLPVFANVIKTVVNRFGNVEAIIGHSFGGGTTLFAMKMKLIKRLPKLVLIASPVDLTWVINDFVEKIGLSKKSKAIYRDAIAKKMGLPFEMGDANNYFKDLDIGKTLIVHDTGDSSVPFQLSENFFHQQKGVDLIATTGLGHFKLVKNKEVIENVTSFIINKNSKH